MIREITPPNQIYVSGKWVRAKFVYSISLILGATVIGSLAGLVGETLYVKGFHIRNLPDSWLVLLAFVALGYSLRELKIIRLPILQFRWQVPANWMRFGKVKQALLYGLVLGAGVFTFIPYSTFYLLLLLEVSMGIGGGMMIGFCYGLVQAVFTFILISYAHADMNKISNVADSILYAKEKFHQLNALALIFVCGLVMNNVFLGT